MKQHSGNAISISVIGGADGPTSIFVAGPGEKRALKARIRDSIYRYKGKERKSGSWLRPILLQKPCSTQKISMA